MAEGDARTFELGLVMAGAISAGAYTAGVIDFLIEALDAFEAEKKKDGYSGPTHKVVLKVMTGASAGAMTSAITAASLHAETEPVRDTGNPPDARRNRFFDAWVRRIDIASLLGDADIRATGRLMSALDASELATIANSALDVPLRSEKREWVDDEVAVFLTVANLRGVPYSFNLFGGDGASGYGMAAHKDHMRFSVNRKQADAPQDVKFARRLDPAALPDGAWPQLAQAALASGAFPIGLQARPLARPRSDYDGHLRQPPNWPANSNADEEYGFLCVDGGLIDNEPLELARSYLAQGGRSPRSGAHAHRAMVMIDPFPNRSRLADDNREKNDILAVALGMFGALISQARFKDEELGLAADRRVYSRFMITPTRDGVSDDGDKLAIASATLDGFGGFLSEAFRGHDFQLGRRNCQRFLQRYFALPESNWLFDGLAPGRRDLWHVRDGAAPDSPRVIYTGDTPDNEPDIDERAPDGSVRNDGPQPMLPIIPLFGSAAEPVPEPALPDPDKAVDLTALEARIRTRATAVAHAMVDGPLRPLLSRGAHRWVARRFLEATMVPRLAAKARDMVRDDIARLKP